MQITFDKITNSACKYLRQGFDVLSAVCFKGCTFVLAGVGMVMTLYNKKTQALQYTHKKNTSERYKRNLVPICKKNKIRNRGHNPLL